MKKSTCYYKDQRKDESGVNNTCMQGKDRAEPILNLAN